ncbi:hypothetical protein IFM89_027700 [Coptis chinensis]|uniref:Uncharacterized protein n=1 Tax=Coptis chinensis TaxID=261450 RepID=A0A835M0X1_9MAGN|nr:hypothetical protein IFM89_027700 [Coptis chinensis]
MQYPSLFCHSMVCYEKSVVHSQWGRVTKKQTHSKTADLFNFNFSFPLNRLLEETLKFKDMKDLDSFTIGVNGINIKLAIGAISETIDFADAIKTSKLSTPQEDFAVWEKTLGVLEKLGMNVYFLRARRGSRLNAL